MLIAGVVFVGVFMVATLLLVASGTGATESAKKTLARLESLVIVQDVTRDEDINLQKEELLSSIPLLNRILLRLEIAPQLRRMLYQANVKWTPGGLLLVSAALWALAAYIIYLKTGAFWFSMVLGLVGGMIPFGYVRWKRSKRLEKFEEGLPAALDLMVSGLRGGHGLLSVMDLVSREAPDPIGPEFRICFDEQNYGLELRSALENLCVRMPIADNRMIMTAILIQKETGGNLAEILEKCASTIRERFRLKREIRSKTAQGRLSGWVLSLMPVGLATAMYFLRPDIISVLWTRPAGLKMLYTGGIMMILGALVIRKIVRVRV